MSNLVFKSGISVPSITCTGDTTIDGNINVAGKLQTDKITNYDEELEITGVGTIDAGEVKVRDQISFLNPDSEQTIARLSPSKDNPSDLRYKYNSNDGMKDTSVLFLSDIDGATLAQESDLHNGNIKYQLTLSDKDNRPVILLYVEPPAAEFIPATLYETTGEETVVGT